MPTLFTVSYALFRNDFVGSRKEGRATRVPFFLHLTRHIRFTIRTVLPFSTLSASPK